MSQISGQYPPFDCGTAHTRSEDHNELTRQLDYCNSMTTNESAVVAYRSCLTKQTTSERPI